MSRKGQQVGVPFLAESTWLCQALDLHDESHMAEDLFTTLSFEIVCEESLGRDFGAALYLVLLCLDRICFT